MVGKARKGLSPLLAIIIGLIVTIVAGILLAQLYFSYAGTISARPAANVEYVDLIEAGTNDILVVNVKNIGNVPINHATLKGGKDCDATYTGPNVQPGATFSLTCSGDLVDGTGKLWNGTLSVSFTDGSNQTYAISVRARSA